MVTPGYKPWRPTIAEFAPLHLVCAELSDCTACHASHNCLQQWTGETALGDALHTTLSRLPRVKFVITTLGRRGSVLIARTDSQEATQKAVLEDLLHSMLDEVGSSNHAADGNGNGRGDGDGSSLLGCTARSGTPVKYATGVTPCSAVLPSHDMHVV